MRPFDTSGRGLHKRGYRPEANAAPLKETLAAALCEISRLRPYHTLYDPMCGSGTILIEGALMALNIAPGVNRRFTADRWRQAPKQIWDEERELAMQFNVTSIPTVLCVKNGEVTGRSVGFVPAQKLLELVK